MSKKCLLSKWERLKILGWNGINGISILYRLFNEIRARLIGWSNATNDMFQWDWVRWNFPEPVLAIF